MKIVSILFIVSVLFLLCSCSFDAGNISLSDTPTFKDDYNQDYEEDYYKNYEEEETTTITTTTTTTESKMTPAELQALIDKQEVKIKSTEYCVQDNQYKYLYPDMLSVVIRNDSDKDIKNALIGFVAWDKNNLPVKIKGNYDYDEGDYLSGCNYNDINLVPNSEYGHDSGYEIHPECNNISTFKAIVIKYETFDGESWTNPYFSDWKELYEGQRLIK